MSPIAVQVQHQRNGREQPRETSICDEDVGTLRCRRVLRFLLPVRAKVEQLLLLVCEVLVGSRSVR